MAFDKTKFKDVAFSTQFDYERLHMRGNFSTTLGAAVTTIRHGLGYVPYVRVWAEWNGAIYPATQSPFAYINVIVNPLNNDIEFQAFAANQGSFGNPVTIYYRIYKDKAV